MLRNRGHKPKGVSHPVNKLTARKVATIREHGSYADGGGLYLDVDDHGKRWRLRVKVSGTKYRRDMGLGSARDVSLGEARELATKYRKTARGGVDPVAARKGEKLAGMSFEDAARKVYEERKGDWRNAKHAAQWISTLESYVFPIIGNLQVSKIDTSDVQRTLAPIWNTKAETARRVKQRIATVLDWAKVKKLRDGENPADAVKQGLGKQKRGQEHRAAVPYPEVPEVVQRIRAGLAWPINKLAIEFVVLTGCRSVEARLATWAEFDIESKLWTIPAGRMKADRQHNVPLSPRVIEVLAEAKKHGAGSKLVFPSNNPKKPLSDATLLKALRSVGRTETVHGFRSSLRDWISERTSYPNEVAELALAHTIKDKTERAYRRGDLFDKRANLMRDWADFVTGNPTSG